ncbi:hypothetical protein B0H34DRAFT_732756 [Crassisporium funariophilum]|nr:hypothetical protein B0H34DRAFT_732756 [Crassisporium funariophilum]
MPRRTTTTRRSAKQKAHMKTLHLSKEDREKLKAAVVSPAPEGDNTDEAPTDWKSEAIKCQREIQDLQQQNIILREWVKDLKERTEDQAKELRDLKKSAGIEVGL